MTNKSILIFGVGPLQKSLIEKCKEKGLFTVGIDPNEKAPCKDLVDVFEVVDSHPLEFYLFFVAHKLEFNLQI